MVNFEILKLIILFLKIFQWYMRIRVIGTEIEMSSFVTVILATSGAINDENVINETPFPFQTYYHDKP